jgi:hypothetical protein
MVSKFAAEIIKEIESDTKESAQHIQQLSKPEICPRYSDNGMECPGKTICENSDDCPGCIRHPSIDKFEPKK